MVSAFGQRKNCNHCSIFLFNLRKSSVPKPFCKALKKMCLAVRAVLVVVGSLWCSKFGSIRCVMLVALSQSALLPETIPGSRDKDEAGRVLSRRWQGAPNDKHDNICILCDCLLSSLSVCTPFSACLFACRLWLFAPLSVCQSVSGLQSNALVTLNVISFLTFLRFQQSVNNHCKK